MAVSDRAPLLSLEDLHAAYGPVAVLRGLDLVVYPGELVCVIGANGAGKTSTLRAVSGLLAPTRGRIVFDGRPIHGAEPADVLAAGIAHCPEGRAGDRKSTRLNSSHSQISYAVFCLKKKKKRTRH